MRFDAWLFERKKFISCRFEFAGKGVFCSNNSEQLEFKVFNGKFVFCIVIFNINFDALPWKELVLLKCDLSFRGIAADAHQSASLVRDLFLEVDLVVGLVLRRVDEEPAPSSKLGNLSELAREPRVNQKV